MTCSVHSARWWAMLLMGGWIGIVGCRAEQEMPAAAIHIAAARAAIQTGDTETAMKELDASIEIEPSVWAFALRARLFAEAGRDDEARADCQAGLELDADNPQIKWIMQELQRAPSSRFKTTTPTITK